MKRYSQDYGLAMFRFRTPSPTNRRPLTRAEAARVIAEPLPKRATGHGKAIAGYAIAVGAWVVAWLVAWAR